MRLWLDVDDLFNFSERNQRPTGIQRLTGEAYLALAGRYPDKVGFVRHAEVPGGFILVDWQDVQATYRRLAHGCHAVRPVPDRATDLHSILSRLMKGIRPSSRAQLASHSSAPFKGVSIAKAAEPSDVLCTLGAPWHDARYEARVAKCKEATGLRFAILIHDLIPLLRPEYFDVGRAPHFERVIAGILPLADAVLTNSKATARDVSAWADRKKIALGSIPHAIPIGAGFDKPTWGSLPAGLHAGEYVLFVSTIEVRKNHQQAFRIWCRLLRELPRDKVPKLVFAGGWGWMVEDLRKAIEATGNLDNKLVVVSSPDDATLAALYRGCQFTLFLSYYEGWGLPVSDSLSFGKVCVASERTSMPEAGGRYCLYVDPDNTTAAFETVKNLVSSPNMLRRLEGELRDNYTPTPWSTTADAIVQALFPGAGSIKDSAEVEPSPVSVAAALRGA